MCYYRQVPKKKECALPYKFVKLFFIWTFNKNTENTEFRQLRIFLFQELECLLKLTTIKNNKRRTERNQLKSIMYVCLPMEAEYLDVILFERFETFFLELKLFKKEIL